MTTPLGLTVRLAACVALALALLTCAPAEAGNAPDFKLKDLDGRWFRLDDHVGDKVIYVSFWATWCVPCRREMPHLEALWQELGDDGLLVVGVNTDPASARSKIKPYVRRHRLTYPTVLDPDNNVLDAYNPTRELPYAVLIDRDGNIFKTFSGYRTGDEKMVEEYVRQLLDGRPESPADGA
jgi:peroxiredoxin